MGRAGIRYSICRAYLRLLYTGKELTSECRGHEVFSLSSRLVMAKAKESGPVKDFAWLCATLMIKTCPVPDPKPWGSSPARCPCGPLALPSRCGAGAAEASPSWPPACLVRHPRCRHAHTPPPPSLAHFGPRAVCRLMLSCLPSPPRAPCRL